MKKVRERLNSDWQEKLRKIDRGEKVTVKGKKECLLGLIRIDWHLTASLLKKKGGVK